MLRTKKPVRKTEQIIKGYKPLYVGEVEIYFKKESTICFPTYSLYMGNLKALIMSETDKGWRIQCNLPHLPFYLGTPLKREQDARQLCIKAAQTFCSMLSNNEK